MRPNDRIRDELERRKQAGGDLPPFWRPETSGETIWGPVERIRESPFEPDAFLYEVADVDTGMVYTLPNHTILNSLLNGFNPHEGDYVLVEFRGMLETKSGRSAWNYAVSVVPKAEVEKLEKEGVSLEPQPGPQPRTQQRRLDDVR